MLNSPSALLAPSEVARTVGVVTQHARGRAAATPDIPAEMEKTASVVSRGAAMLLHQPDAVEELMRTVVEALQSAETGPAAEHVIRAVTERMRDITIGRLKGLSRELSTETGIPAAALRTKVGMLAALKADGEERGLDEIDEMPGTLTVLALRELIELGGLRSALESGEVARELTKLWTRRKPTGRGFDAVIDHERRRHPQIDDLGWALINLEGRHHVNLIWHQANKLQRSFPDREASELLSFGWIGLRTALRNYKPALGFAFSTYACTRIVGAIRDGVRAENPVPKRLGTLARKAAAVETELAQSLGRTPTMTEISEALRIESHTLEAIRRTRTPASIEEIISGIDRTGSNEPGWLSTGSTAEEDAIFTVEAERISLALEELGEDEAEAIRLLILEDRSPTEAKTIAGVTARQLRQRKERALLQLRSALHDLEPGI